MKLIPKFNFFLPLQEPASKMLSLRDIFLIHLVPGRITTALLLLLSLSLCSLWQLAHAQSLEGRQSLSRARTAALNGDLERAIEEWTVAEDAFLQAGDNRGRIEVLLRRAEAYARRGFVPEAVADLNLCRGLAEDIGEVGRLAEIDGAMGSALLYRDRPMAEHLLRQSLARAKSEGRWGVAASTLNNLGNILAIGREVVAAREAYEESTAAAIRAGDSLIAATAGINAARLAVAGGDADAAQLHLAGVRGQLEQLPLGSARTRLTLAQAVVLLRMHENLGDGADARRYHIYRGLTLAASDATTLSDPRDMAAARGYLGHLYEVEGRLSEALTLTREAIFTAQQLDEAGLLYRWYWQAGRLMKALGEPDQAIDAYRNAIDDLQLVRADLVLQQEAGAQSFRETTGAVYFELADLLLKRATAAEDETIVHEALQEAREAIELFKAAELEDYFQDDCVATLQARERRLDRLEKGTAAIYPIPLADRLEIILTIGDRLQHVQVDVREEHLTDLALALRQSLQEDYVASNYRKSAQQLYQWLIEPIRPILMEEQITTLVVVPDGVLRTIPFAALYDGEAFLIESYAVAVVPGLTLLDPKPLSRVASEIFVSALTKPVQGWSALPAVADEVGKIGEIFDINLLQDEDFVFANVEREFSRQAYSVIHVASHGVFAENARDSYLLTYDGKITMNQLERLIKLGQFRDEPVELLTLSACQTAAGNDRAALGLSGIAVKAGARSVMGSLWLIADEATALLVADFYQRLHDNKMSKAEALQQAQLALMRDPRYGHPFFWSPFLIIGNWL